jgi:hypothetical protein
MSEKIDEKTLETLHANVHTAAKNFEAQEVERKAVDALIECINDTWEHRGLAGVLSVCTSFVDTAHEVLLLEASPTARKKMGEEVNALMLGLAKEMAKSNAEFKASQK